MSVKVSGLNQQMLDLAELCASSAPESAIDECLVRMDGHSTEILAAETITLHPLYDPALKSLRLRTLAGDEEAMKACGGVKALGVFDRQEDLLRNIFTYHCTAGGAIFFAVAQRSNLCSKVDHLVRDLLLEVGKLPSSPILLTLEYLSAEREFCILYQGAVNEDDWLLKTFHLDALCRASAPGSAEDLLGPRLYTFWIPDLDGSRILCSNSGSESGAKIIAGSSISDWIVQLPDSSSFVGLGTSLKTFSLCSSKETSDLLRSLARKESWECQSASQFFLTNLDLGWRNGGFQSELAPAMIRVFSPSVSMAVFVRERAMNGAWSNDQVLLKRQQKWELVPFTQLDAREDSSTNVNWPWQSSFILEDGSRFNLSANPPFFSHLGRSFSVKPLQSEDYLNAGILPRREHELHFGHWRWVDNGFSFSTASPVLLLQEEAEKMTAAMADCLQGHGKFPPSLVNIVKDYLDLDALTLPGSIF